MVTKTYLFANLKGISFYSSSVLWYKRYEYTAIYYTLYIHPNINTQHLSLSTNQSKALESQMLKIVCLTLYAKVNRPFISNALHFAFEASCCDNHSCRICCIGKRPWMMAGWALALCPFRGGFWQSVQFSQQACPPEMSSAISQSQRRQSRSN